MGHPWTEINGPICAKNGIQFNLHLCGEEQYFVCQCCCLSYNGAKSLKIYKCAYETDCNGDMPLNPPIISEDMMTSKIVSV